MHCRLLFVVSLASCLLLFSPLQAADPTVVVFPRQALFLAGAGSGGRAPLPVDPLVAKLVAGMWVPPKAGDSFAEPNGRSSQWEKLDGDANGRFVLPARHRGYVYFPVHSPKEQVLLLASAGHSIVMINGEPHAGDPYEYGYVRLPVQLHQGRNDLLFRVERGGRLQVGWVTPRVPVSFDLADLTLPDVIQGQAVQTLGAVIIINATAEPQAHLYLSASHVGSEPAVTGLPPLPPLSMRKVGFHIKGPAPKVEKEYPVKLRLLTIPEGAKIVQDSSQRLDEAEIKLAVRQAGEMHKRTFVSNIDGSVQYYAIVPAKREASGDPPGLVLSLHGAAVEASGQAACYAPRTWAHIVAPTNRRPYGFDWEDWGRLDALEVLDRVQEELHTDRRHTYLTGHSMGGHGTWHLGVTFPDRFAAIGPSAGWVSFWSYAGGPPRNASSPLGELLERPALGGDTLALAKNLVGMGVYVLHGDKDDNVPVDQARTMRAALAPWHPDFVYHEQPGAGHWWGNPCVDWPPMLDFLARHVLPEPAAIRRVDFTTANPGVSSRCHWATIEAQIHALRLSHIQIEADNAHRRFVGTTDNVARLAIDVGHLSPGAPITVELDDQVLPALTWPAGPKRLWLMRTGGHWRASDRPSPAHKGPARNGPFKEAFRNRMQLVYSTHGTPEENAWSQVRARFDAEQFWYRGNGSIDVLSDTEFVRQPEPERNVIVYGHRESNGAWNLLLGASPVQVERGRVRVGTHQDRGEDLACLFVRPRPGSDRALVGVVSGTGLAGLRTTDCFRIFLSGVEYPDCLVVSSAVLERGTDGVRGAGFFGNDWGVDTGEFVWHAAGPRP